MCSRLLAVQSWTPAFVYPEDCAAPLAITQACTGFDRTFQEAYYAKLARGRPHQDDCAARLRSAPSAGATCWSERECAPLGVKRKKQREWRCFVCEESGGNEFRGVKMLALQKDCLEAISFKVATWDSTSHRAGCSTAGSTSQA